MHGTPKQALGPRLTLRVQLSACLLSPSNRPDLFCIYTSALTHRHIYTHSLTHTYTTLTHTHTHTYTHILTITHTHPQIYTHTLTLIHTHSHIYTRTLTLTHTHALTHRKPMSVPYLLKQAGTHVETTHISQSLPLALKPSTVKQVKSCDQLSS